MFLSNPICWIRFLELIFVEFPQEHNVQKGYAFVHYEVSPEGRMSAYQAVNALADTVIDNVRYVTEFSRNFMRLEHSLNETPARPTIYGVPYPGYGFIPTPPYPMAQPRYLYPMPFLSYQVPQMYPTAYYTMPYPPRPHLHPSTQTPSIPVPYPYATETNYPTTAADTPPSSSSNWSPVDDPMVPPENDISVPRQDPVQYSWTPPAYLPTPYSLPYPPRPMPQGIYYPPPLYSTPPPPQYFTSYPYHPPTEEN